MNPKYLKISHLFFLSLFLCQLITTFLIYIRSLLFVLIYIWGILFDSIIIGSIFIYIKDLLFDLTHIREDYYVIEK